MEKQLIRANLHRIISIAEQMQIPGSAERIAELARHTLHMSENLNQREIELGLIVAMLADSTRVRDNGAVDFEDLRLLDKAAQEAHKKFPKEPKL